MADSSHQSRWRVLLGRTATPPAPRARDVARKCGRRARMSSRSLVLDSGEKVGEKTDLWLDGARLVGGFKDVCVRSTFQDWRNDPLWLWAYLFRRVAKSSVIDILPCTLGTKLPLISQVLDGHEPNSVGVYIPSISHYKDFRHERVGWPLPIRGLLTHLHMTYEVPSLKLTVRPWKWMVGIHSGKLR